MPDISKILAKKKTGTSTHFSSPSIMARLTPEEVSEYQEPDWFKKGLELATKRKEQAQKEKEHIRAITKEPLTKIRKIDEQITQRVNPLQNDYDPSKIATEGVKLGFEIRDLIEQRNRVGAHLKELGMDYSPLELPPSDTLNMQIYVQRIKNKQIFRPAKKEN